MSIVTCIDCRVTYESFNDTCDCSRKPTKWKKKPIVINAIKWTGKNLDEVKKFVPPKKFYYAVDGNKALFDKEGVYIETLEGMHYASIGDWIIQGARGDDYYPCKPDIFQMTYEKVDD